MSAEELSDEFRLGLRSIDGLPGVAIRGAPRRSPDGKDAWAFDVDLTPGDLGTVHEVPETTRWVVVVAADYPYGEVDIRPARRHGLTLTFQHQLANDDGPYWRMGKVCVALHDAVLGRLAKVAETFEPGVRLRWHIERAMAWIRAASRGELALPGDPFELPDFNTPDQPTVVFSETASTYQRWSGEEMPHAGLVDLRAVRSRDRAGHPQRFVAAFHDSQGREVIATPWGTYFGDVVVMPRGFWLLLPQFPVVEPWSAIRTWGQLRDVCGRVGIDLDATLAPILDQLRPRGGRKWRKRARKYSPTRVGLIGMPIPSTVDGPPVQIHWQSLMLPGLAAPGSAAMRGFRPTRRSFQAVDRREVFASNQMIPWTRSENWSIDQIAARGVLAEDARSVRVVLLGAGTIGSLTAEVLVRLGVRDVTIIDPDRLHGGNLVRHTLTTSDTGESKATRLAERLSAAHPSVTADGYSLGFPAVSEEARAALDRCDVVLDTTGSDDVARALARFDWSGPKTFVSLSIAMDAERLFAFAATGASFDGAEFFSWLNPIAEAERLRTPPLPIEGAGCWHPVMPARWDRIMTLVGLITPWVEEHLARPSAKPAKLIVDLPRLP